MRTKPPTDSIILDRARRLRREMTEAERKLWRFLRDRTLVGVKFRRQVPIGNFIADFCCLDSRLIVELDGGQHADQEDADASRSRFLAKEGFRVLRFWNEQVLNGAEFAVEEILAVIASDPRPPSPGARNARRPLPKGEAG
jgi:very-short-patch-repair endonuclease